jgi:AcrR family transcriptional regulator
MVDQGSKGRINQQRRTRKDLLLAAARLLREGRSPSMEEVAQEALVSRATAYRYFPSVEALLVEAPLDGEVPDPEDLFAGDASVDAEERVDRAEAALHSMVYRNEAQLRLMLAHSLHEAAESSAPVRQNRRTALIEAALTPLRDRLDSDTYERLCAALALFFGPESMIVFRDVVPLDESAAREVKSWALRAVVRAALSSSSARSFSGRRHTRSPSSSS